MKNKIKQTKQTNDHRDRKKKRGTGLVTPAILFYFVLKPLIYMASLWLQNNAIW